VGIVIKEIDHYNRNDVNRCDGAFTVDSRLILTAENGVIQFTVISTPPYLKRYPLDEVDFAAYINNPGKTVFLAYLDDQIAGQLRLSRYWNGYAYIEDIVVDSRFRRRGVGRELIQQAMQWAKDQQLAGVMLETQNNNVAACRLYERCGFELSGFDRRLYQGLHPGTDEIALYWYWMCNS
jgi:streptothricin acetyltransferase